MKPQVSVLSQSRRSFERGDELGISKEGELEILHCGDNERDDTDSPDTKTKDEIRQGVSGFMVSRSPEATRKVAAVVWLHLRLPLNRHAQPLIRVSVYRVGSPNVGRFPKRN